MEEMDLREEVRVAWGTGIAGYVAESGESLNIPDAYQVKFAISFLRCQNWKHENVFGENKENCFAIHRVCDETSAEGNQKLIEVNK